MSISHLHSYILSESDLSDSITLADLSDDVLKPSQDAGITGPIIDLAPYVASVKSSRKSSKRGTGVARMPLAYENLKVVFTGR